MGDLVINTLESFKCCNHHVNPRNGLRSLLAAFTAAIGRRVARFGYATSSGVGRSGYVLR